jgi:hypothetical protein
MLSRKMKMRLKLNQIKIDAGTQPRTAIDQPTVSEYTQVLMEGAIFPPVDVFFDGIDYYLADGYHRYFAHKQAVVPDIEVRIHNGTQREAVLFSVGANARHGLKRSHEDRRKAVLTLLTDAEWIDWSDREIARKCCVSHVTVSKIRKDMDGDVKKEKTYKTTNGNVAVMDTTNIGKSKPKKTEVVDVEEEVDEEYDKLQELHVINHDLKEEIQTLNDKLAVASVAGSTEEKNTAKDLITDLRKQVKTLEAENDALRSQLATKMNQNAEMMKQVAYYKKRVEKLEKTST